MQFTSFGKGNFLKAMLLIAFGLAAMAPITVYADSGFYAGGSLGSATISAEIPDEDLGEVFEFDENDFAWKAFAGYNFDLPVLNLGIEGGYVDLGSPSTQLLGVPVSLDVTGWDVFGVAGIDLGPIGVFAKAGLITWDAEATVDGIAEDGDDGSDPAYGVGAKFNLGSLEIRGEYEYFDLESADDVYLLSAGFVFHFGG
jgi:hypothetical protein